MSWAFSAFRSSAVETWSEAKTSPLGKEETSDALELMQTSLSTLVSARLFLVSLVASWLGLGVLERLGGRSWKL